MLHKNKRVLAVSMLVISVLLAACGDNTATTAPVASANKAELIAIANETAVLAGDLIEGDHEIAILATPDDSHFA